MFSFSPILSGTPVLFKLAMVLTVALVNSSILYLIVFFFLRFSKNMHAKLKHHVWFFVICIFFLIPVFSILIPSPQLIQPPNSIEDFLSSDFRDSTRTQGAASSTPTQYLHVIEDYSYKPLHIPTSSSTVNNPEASIAWQSVVCIIWIAGIALSLLHVLAGRCGLHFMTRSAIPDKDSLHTSLLKALRVSMNIGHDIQLYRSDQCITPFTCFLFKPVIMLPSNTRKWSTDRLRVVLLHELAHIKRKDHVTRLIARLLCALLWFIPPLWIAYNRMQDEEEKACDAVVIGTGVKTSDYASHIVDIARSTRGRVLSFMLQHSFSKRSSLEPRITNILRLRKTSNHVRTKVLIRILVVCFACVLVLQMMNPLPARKNKPWLIKKAPPEVIFGHWFNENDYDKWKVDRTGQYAGKMIIRTDGTIQHFLTPECPELPYIGCNGHYIIEDSYIDREGNHLYKIAIVHTPLMGPYNLYELWKIDPSRSKMEITWDFSDYPTEINPSIYEYYTFYRKQQTDLM